MPLIESDKRWCGPSTRRLLKYSLVFLFGLGVGIGIVCIVLRSYGLLGASRPSTFKADHIELGELPLEGAIEYGFVDVVFTLSPVDQAHVFNPTYVQLYRQDEVGSEFLLVNEQVYSKDGLMKVAGAREGEALEPGREYMYKYVLQFADGRRSNYSGVTRVRQRDPMPPKARSVHKLKADSSSVAVVWKPYSKEEAMRQFGTEVEEYRVVEGGRVHHVKNHWYVLEGVQAGGVVRVRVEAASEVGVSLRSDELVFRANDLGNTAVPTKVEGVVVEGRYKGGVVKWEKKEREGGSDILYYEVEIVGNGKQTIYVQNEGNERIVSSLASKRYKARVRAVNSVGSGEWSEGVEWKVLDFCEADAMEGVHVKYVWKDAFSVFFSMPSKPKCRSVVSSVRVVDLDNNKVVCEQKNFSVFKFCDVLRGEGGAMRVGVVAVNEKGEGEMSKPLTVKLSKAAGKCNTISEARWFVHSPGYNPDTTMNWSLAKFAIKAGGDGKKAVARLQQELGRKLATMQKDMPYLGVLSEGCAACFAQSVDSGVQCATQCGGGQKLHEPACHECTKLHKLALGQCAGLDKTHMPPLPSEPVGDSSSQH